MKLFFSFVFILSTCLNARDIIIIRYDQQKQIAQKIKVMIVDKIGVPDNLVTLQKSQKPCEKQNGAIMQICLTNDGNMNIPVYRRRIMQKAFAHLTLKE